MESWRFVSFNLGIFSYEAEAYVQILNAREITMM